MRNFYLLLIGCAFISCNNNNASKYPGICLSFDDRSVDEWFQLRELFNKNSVKVTFFITQPDSLNSAEVNKLKQLEQDGHEIGFHGNMHISPRQYIKEYSYADYMDNEINKGMRTMDSLGFNCVSFAYPYGAEYWFTDFLLLKKFDLLRDISSLKGEKDLTKMDGIYYSFNGDRTLSAIGIDVISGVNESMINKALQRAVNNKEVLLLYGHRPTDSKEAKGYSTKIELLNHIIRKAKENNMKFYTMKELKMKEN